jgi:hypothetical protein
MAKAAEAQEDMVVVGALQGYRREERCLMKNDDDRRHREGGGRCQGECLPELWPNMVLVLMLLLTFWKTMSE